MQKSGAHCLVEKLSKANVAAIERSDSFKAIEWFFQHGDGVYVVQVQSGSRLTHAVAVNISAELLIDSDQPVQLRIWAAAFWVGAGGGQGGSGLISGRRMFKT